MFFDRPFMYCISKFINPCWGSDFWTNNKYRDSEKKGSMGCITPLLYRVVYHILKTVSIIQFFWESSKVWTSVWVMTLLACPRLSKGMFLDCTVIVSANSSVGTGFLPLSEYISSGSETLDLFYIDFR